MSDANSTAPFAPLLRLRGLRKHFGPLKAVDGIDLEVGRGETVGIVGESGCGKSTLGKTAIRIHDPSAGSIEFDDGAGMRDITTVRGRGLRELRRHMNIVFQDPFSSLNPRKTVRFSIGEPLVLSGTARGAAVGDRVAELLEMVGLPARYMERFPHAFSGGQRQRIALARAIALSPKLIVADEAVSALDVSVQAQIVNLFTSLQKRLGIAFMFVSHDLKIVRHVSDRIVVMYLGRIVEQGLPDEICARPKHPYTAALLSAVPTVETGRRDDRMILKGDPPSPSNPPSGCHFRTRCPFATDRCATEAPELRRIPGRPGEVACHHSEQLALRGIAASPVPMEIQ